MASPEQVAHELSLHAKRYERTHEKMLAKPLRRGAETIRALDKKVAELDEELLKLEQKYEDFVYGNDLEQQ